MTANQTAALQAFLPGMDLPAYQAPSGFDEMVEADGSLRPRWRPFMEMLAAQPPGEMARRWDRGLRLIRDAGMTHTAPGGPTDGTPARPWTLDPVPLLLDAREWGYIEYALTQRATLFNAVLADLYGNRALLNEAQVPPALVHANPGFLRPLHGVKPKDGTFLHFYAADLARAPDGRWWVVNDRTETPSGAGYALENRLIISRILPDFYRATEVQRLAPYFMKLRENLTRLAPRPIDNPRIVVWTPGPYNATHPEHAYLARYLGLTLVEGEDMTTRDRRVYLKTLEGLKQVDVIIRHNGGGFCDPLELRGESTLGVPGLVEAVHAGTVTVANAIGSRLVEAPAFMPFLPALCRRLLGQELVMPSLATWWCGQERESRYVRDHLDDLVVRPAFNVHAPPIAVNRLAPKARATLLADLAARPWAYVGQEAAMVSTTPVWEGGRLTPRPMIMRVHLAAYGDSYVVMPGGLTRVAPPGVDDQPWRINADRDGGAKDTWVLSDEPVAPITLLRDNAEPPRRGSRDLPSRVTDNTFWLGRYAERCEDTARLLRKACMLAAENGFGEPELAVVLSVMAGLGHLPAEEDYSEPTVQEAALRILLSINADPEEPLGLVANLANLRRAANAVRDRLSVDTWRVITRLCEAPFDAPGTRGPLDLETPQSQLDGLIMTLLALDGLALENMTRGLGWRFLDIGRRLERAHHVLDLLSAPLIADTADIGPALDVILDINDSAMTYRSRYLSLPSPAPVLDILLSDESNPRSLGYQVALLAEHMEILAPDQAFGLRTEEQRLMIRLLASVRATDPRAITLDPKPAAGRIGLSCLLGDLRDGLSGLGQALTLHYFAHAVETRADIAGHPDLATAQADHAATLRPPIHPIPPKPESAPVSP
ncbi:hypothetical protein CKO38_02360, partial [Rhodospirillum rubrum]|uniref:circularly permuted type 2 ATP-grasp protein n=1 Tax=Rhodospirillum rubrum TaxID=1085 RepID=UPI001906DB69